MRDVDIGNSSRSVMRLHGGRTVGELTRDGTRDQSIPVNLPCDGLMRDLGEDGMRRHEA